MPGEAEEWAKLFHELSEEERAIVRAMTLEKRYPHRNKKRLWTIPADRPIVIGDLRAPGRGNPARGRRASDGR